MAKKRVESGSPWRTPVAVVPSEVHVSRVDQVEVREESWGTETKAGKDVAPADIIEYILETSRLIVEKSCSSSGWWSLMAESNPAIEAAISTPPETPTANCKDSIWPPTSFPTLLRMARPRRRKSTSPTPMGRNFKLERFFVFGTRQRRTGARYLRIWADDSPFNCLLKMLA